MAKIRLLVLCGGQSEEHEVSLSSAKSVLSALPKDRFEVTPVVITREGKWLPPSQTPAALERGSAPSGGEIILAQASSALGFDAVFPLLHGPMGEDGTIQGLLRLAGIPFVGSSVLASSVCMDKIMMKSVLAAHRIAQVAYQAVSKAEFSNPDVVLERLQSLGFPVFVKPANLGSSVGISKAKNIEELRVALRLAFEFDRRVIVEASAGSKPRELEVAILGNDHPKASVVGELTFASEFYDYETKYTDGKAQMHIPADIPPEVAAQVQQLALQAFSALDCAGLARIDFFYLETGEVYLNELNTMPGFTKTSMYPKLWEATGIGYAELVSKLVELALERD
ncbi:MAG: D-alanine--D-alanine ligase family protein [Deinococcales bacterium]